MQDDCLSRMKKLFKSLIYLIYSSIKFNYFFYLYESYFKDLNFHFILPKGLDKIIPAGFSLSCKKSRLSRDSLRLFA